MTQAALELRATPQLHFLRTGLSGRKIRHFALICVAAIFSQEKCECSNLWSIFYVVDCIQFDYD
jgi:hypothetical protein